MSRSNIPRPADERPPLGPWRWSFPRLGCALAVVAGVGGWVGLLLGSLLGQAQGLSGPWLQLAGLLAGVGLGGALGALQFRAVIGRGMSTRAGPLPRGPADGGQAFNERVTVLRDTLATTLALKPSRHVNRLPGHKGPVLALAVSPDGRSALSAGRDHSVRLWDLASGFEVRAYSGFRAAVRAVAFSHDGRLAAAGGQDGPPGQPLATQGVVRVYDVESGQELRRFEVAGAVHALAFSPVGRHLLVGADDYLRLWDVDSTDLAALIHLSSSSLDRDAILSLALSPDGRFALAGLRGAQEARLVDLDSGECPHRFPVRRRRLPLFRPLAVTSVAFSPDGRRALAGSLDQTARVWDGATGKELTRFRGHRGRLGWRGVTGVACLPDGERALSAGEDGTVRLWSTAGGKELQRFEHGARVTCLACGPGGRLVLSGGKDGIIRLWRVS